MANRVKPLETISLFDLLSSKNKARGIINFEGVNIPIEFTPSLAVSNNIIYKFHGAVDRSDAKRALPVFTPSHTDLRHKWNQVSICDPMLILYENLSISWYIGCKNINLQDIFPKLFSEINRFFMQNKVVYFGGSSGGFAALFYSARDAGSVAVVLNPQSKLENFYTGLVKSYLKTCWDTDDLNNLNKKITHDVSKLYNNRQGNTVVYMQNGADLHHLHRHFEPFIASVGTRVEASNRGVSDLISEVAFWGKKGHSTTPPSAYLPWLDAIESAVNSSPEAILQARADHIAQERKMRTAPAAPAQTPKGFAENDLVLADAIAKWSAP